jgi:hypothetical protein
MTQAFDPYHQWLGIQPKDQPPHYYRIREIDLFEENPEVNVLVPGCSNPEYGKAPIIDCPAS